MSQYFAPHPQNPQPRLIRQAAQIVRDGGVIAMPTDSCYAIACQLDDKDAVTKLRRIRGIDDKHHLALLCRDLSEIAQYAQVDNVQYRLLKSVDAGPLRVHPARHEARYRSASRIRRGRRSACACPDNAIAQALLHELDGPLLSSTLMLPGESAPMNDGEEIRARLESVLDLVLDGGACGIEPSTRRRSDRPRRRCW